MLIRVRVVAAHTRQSIRVMRYHGFTTQKWPHIMKIMQVSVFSSKFWLSKKAHTKMEVMHLTSIFVWAFPPYKILGQISTKNTKNGITFAICGHFCAVKAYYHISLILWRVCTATTLLTLIKTLVFKTLKTGSNEP